MWTLYIYVHVHVESYLNSFNLIQISGQRFMFRQHIHGKTTDFLRHKILLKVFFFKGQIKDKITLNPQDVTRTMIQ